MPIKFELDNNGLPVINATATIGLQLLGRNQTTTIDPSLYAKHSNGGTSFRFDQESDLYIYNLDTKKLQPGHYRVTASIAETGQTHADTFTLTEAASRGRGR